MQVLFNNHCRKDFQHITIVFIFETVDPKEMETMFAPELETIYYPWIFCWSLNPADDVEPRESNCGKSFWEKENCEKSCCCGSDTSCTYATMRALPLICGD